MATKIFMCVPAFGSMISATTFLTTHHLQQVLSSKGIVGGISTLSFPDIAELRSMYLTIFHDTMDASHLLFIDADMGFHPDLVMDMLLLNEPVVGTIYRQRKEPVSWAGSGNGEAQAQRRGNFMEVEGVGMGCTLIRRDAVQIMLEKMPEMVDTRLALHPAGETLRAAGATRLIRAFEKLDLKDRGIVSEDLSFCLRWRQCGGQVWASIGHRISHVGPNDFAGRYLDQFEQAAAAPIAIGQTNSTPVAPAIEVLPPASSETPSACVAGAVDAAQPAEAAAAA